MNDVLVVVNTLAAVVVLAEAMNKLERCNPLARGIDAHARLVDSLKAVAWLLLALGAAGELAAPILVVAEIPPGLAAAFLGAPRPSLGTTATLAGFAVLIVRTRVKEG